MSDIDTGDLVARLRGRAQFLYDRGEIKSPDIIMDAADAIEALQALVRELEVLAELNRGDAFAATNPANWQRGDTPENRLRHYEKTLIEISERAEDVTVLEDIFATGIQVGRSESAVRIEDVRNQALEDAATVAAERVRKWVDFEPPYDGDLDEAIDLVEGLPDAIRAMKNI